MRNGMAVGVAIYLAAGLAVASHGAPAKEFFAPSERESVLDFWSAPGRYRVLLPPEAARSGAYQVRLTPEGSAWLWRYGSGLGRTKTRNLLASQPSPATINEWDAWVEGRIAYDRYLAGREASSRNGMLMALEAPNDPGNAPASLVASFGTPPRFAMCTRPMLHAVDFGDGLTLQFSDNPNLRSDYAYYRFSQGVMSGGTPVKQLANDEIEPLLSDAGVSGSLRKVMQAVSLLEGGFDSINTYDTGFVSVGFIQFACLTEGGGSLGGVLLRQKQDNPESFEEDFRRFGVDVSDDGKLIAMDLTTGSELFGPEAAQAMIDDKRLIAVFQRAGRSSKAFRVAQLQVAKDRYFPGNDAVTITVGDKVLAGKVSDVIKSEAGLATLMDRKVHTGNLSPLPKVLSTIAANNAVTSLSDLSAWEADIVAAMKHRRDYLSDPTLTKPGFSPQPRKNSSKTTSRKSTRKGRR